MHNDKDDHEQTHSHEHTHRRDHEHDHEHNHEHNHEHDHVHEQKDNGQDSQGVSPRELALLKYMLQHNRQHARELAETGAVFEGAGLSAAAKYISGAVHDFDHANEKLEKAIELIEERE